MDDQDPGAQRCAWQPCSCRTAARPSLRSRGAPPRLDGVAFGALTADQAFDSNAVIAALEERGAKSLIAQHPRRAKPRPLDAEISKGRHLIENFSCTLKQFKRLARRADKTDTGFKAFIHLAAALINAR